MDEAYKITKHTGPMFPMGAAIGVSIFIGLPSGLFLFTFIRMAYPHHGWPISIALVVGCSIVAFVWGVYSHIQRWRICNPSGREERPGRP